MSETRTREDEPTAMMEVDPFGDTMLPADLAEEQSQTAALHRREENLLSRLQRISDGVKVIERRAEGLATLRKIAIKQTNPNDWVLFKSPDGSEIGILASSGSRRVAQLFGIKTTNLMPSTGEGIFTPVRTDLKGGGYALRGFVNASCYVTGGVEHGIEAQVRSDEQFTGRKTNSDTGKFAGRGDETDEGDLRSALTTRLRTKAVRILAGFNQVPIHELQAAGIETSRCRHGHGYGTSTDRSADTVTSDEAKGQREVLGKTILILAGGDKEEAKRILKECTKKDPYKKKDGTMSKAFGGSDSLARLTQDWQVDKAVEGLMRHPEHGDDAKRIFGAGGVDPDGGGREPGDE